MLGVRTAAWLVTGCALAAASTFAAAESATFEIQVTLNGGGTTGSATNGGGDGFRSRPGAVCMGGTAGDAAQALIEVLCTVGPFVTIAPAPGVSAMHAGEPSRTEVRPGSPLASVLGAAGGFDPRVVVGTLTALQVSNATGNSSALEMLVSF